MEKLSLGRVVVVRGVEVRRMPLGKYLEAIEEVSRFPSELLNACFPEMTLGEMLDRLVVMDEELMRRCISSAAVGAPMAVVGLVARILEVPKERLLEDPEIGMDGFLEIVNAVLEINSLGKLVGEALKLGRSVTSFGSSVS